MVYYPLGDHLGSTSLVLNAGGTVHSQARYYPYGETRWTAGTLPTDYRFTGQRRESGLGLYQMGARWYDPALGRWLSPDTLVPDSANPQSFNRYAWVLDNPLRYRDPTGLFEEEQLKEWFPDQWKLWQEKYPWYWQMLLQADFGDIVSADWDAFVGYFYEPEPGGPPVICPQGGGDCQTLTTWGGHPFVARNEKGEYGQIYSYILIHRDRERHVTEEFQFGDHSVRWQCNGPICDVRMKYMGYQVDPHLLNAQGGQDFWGGVVTVAGIVTEQAVKRLGGWTLVLQASKAMTVVGGLWTAYDLALLVEDVIYDDVVTTKRYRWIDWTTSPYMWE